MPAICFGVALAGGLAAGIASTPVSAQAQSLHVGSPPAVLNDPVVQRCRLLAGRRVDPKLDALSTRVENAAMQMLVEPVFDAVATCRAALARYPSEPKVIVAQANASDALSALLLGLKFPDSDEQAFAVILDLATKATSAAKDAPTGPMFTQMMGFFLGSGFEYGIGTKPDRAAAMKWYAVAAEAGDPISKRELARLQGAKP